MKKVWISIFTISIALNGFGQDDCYRYINQQTNVINTTGILKFLGKAAGVVDAIAGTNLSSLTNSTNKLKELDILQYNACIAMKNLKDPKGLEQEAINQLNQFKKMLGILENDGIIPANTTKSISQSAPTPKSTVEETGKEPCDSEDFKSDKDFIRATGTGWHIDKTEGIREARIAALENLTFQVEVTLNSVTETYSYTKKNTSIEFEKHTQTITREITKQTLSGVVIACNGKCVPGNRQNNTLDCYIALEISREDVLKSAYNKLQQDKQVKEVLPDYREFKETFDRMMNEWNNKGE